MTVMSVCSANRSASARLVQALLILALLLVLLLQLKGALHRTSSQEDHCDLVSQAQRRRRTIECSSTVKDTTAPGDLIHLVTAVLPTRQSSADLTRLAQSMSHRKHHLHLVVVQAEIDNQEEEEGPRCSHFVQDIARRNQLQLTHLLVVESQTTKCSSTKMDETTLQDEAVRWMRESSNTSSGWLLLTPLSTTYDLRLFDQIRTLPPGTIGAFPLSLSTSGRDGGHLLAPVVSESRVIGWAGAEGVSELARRAGLAVPVSHLRRLGRVKTGLFSLRDMWPLAPKDILAWMTETKRESRGTTQFLPTEAEDTNLPRLLTEMAGIGLEERRRTRLADERVRMLPVCWEEACK